VEARNNVVVESTQVALAEVFNKVLSSPAMTGPGKLYQATGRL
jgi:hypothetical protein